MEKENCKFDNNIQIEQQLANQEEYQQQKFDYNLQKQINAQQNQTDYAIREQSFIKRIEELTALNQNQEKQIQELIDENQEFQELQQVYQAQQDQIAALSQRNEELLMQLQHTRILNLNSLSSRSMNRDSGVGIEQYQQLAAENEKLKFQLGDMIDKYKILYTNIKELQEERQKERQAQIELQNKLRVEQSINPFSIASVAATSNGDKLNHQKDEIEKIEKSKSHKFKNQQTQNFENQNEILRHQSGGSSEQSHQIQNKNNYSGLTSNVQLNLIKTGSKKNYNQLDQSLNQQSYRISENEKSKKFISVLHQQNESSTQKNRRGGSVNLDVNNQFIDEQFHQLKLQMQLVLSDKQEQEQELIKARVEWATLELECDRLRHELQIRMDREQQLAAEKFEESLKLSILEKQTEINDRIKQKQQERFKPQIKKLGKLLQLVNPRKSVIKKQKDQGTYAAEFEQQDESPGVGMQGIKAGSSVQSSSNSGRYVKPFQGYADAQTYNLNEKGASSFKVVTSQQIQKSDQQN